MSKLKTDPARSFVFMEKVLTSLETNKMVLNSLVRMITLVSVTYSKLQTIGAYRITWIVIRP